MVSRDEIFWAYRFILGRDPEGESAYRAHVSHADWTVMRDAILQSPEARQRVGQIVNRPQEAFDYFRPLLVFIHVEKTGGTSLLDALTRGKDMRVAPHGLSHLPSMTLGFLNQYDCIAGHFTYQEAAALPRHPKRMLTMLRDPAERLISLYRFHRAHGPEARDNVMVRLAHDLSPIDFFRHPAIATSHRVFNSYVHNLAGLPGHPSRCTEAAMTDATERSLRILLSLDAVGITERMKDSVRLFRNRIDPLLSPVDMLNRTDGLDRAAGYRPVDPVVAKGELEEAIASLTVYDRIIYEFADDLLTEELNLDA